MKHLSITHCLQTTGGKRLTVLFDKRKKVSGYAVMVSITDTGETIGVYQSSTAQHNNAIYFASKAWAAFNVVEIHKDDIGKKDYEV